MSPNGNITTKTDAGTYTYDPSKPHAVQSVTDPLGLMPLTQNITYTPFQRPETITEGDYELTLTYGPDNNRKKSILNFQGLPQRTITYSGNYEKIEIGSDVYEVHYITSPAGLVAINVRQNVGADNLFYVYTDHLGSILTLTDAAGTVVYEQNFDPWGRERNPNDWSYTPNPNTKPPWLIRGFTGHEHIDEVALINMNARMYDPIVARVLSPDNYVQASDFTQSYNRYSYVLNNPLVYSDPSGEFIGFVAAGFALGYYLGSSAYMGNYNIFSGDWWQGQSEGAWKAGVVGGIIGAGAGTVLAAGVGAAGTGFGTGFVSQGPSSFAWTVASQSLITANINIASAAIQEKDLDRTLKSGLIGLGAGAIGATVGASVNYRGLGRAVRQSGRSKNSFQILKYAGKWTKAAIRAQNITTATLVGASETIVDQYDEGVRDFEKLVYAGFVGGLYGAWQGLTVSALGNRIITYKSGFTGSPGRYLINITTSATNIFSLHFILNKTDYGTYPY